MNSLGFVSNEQVNQSHFTYSRGKPETTLMPRVVSCDIDHAPDRIPILPQSVHTLGTSTALTCPQHTAIETQRPTPSIRSC